MGFLFQVDEQNKQDQNDDYGTYDRANICKVHFFLSDSSIQPFSFSINLCDFFVFGARNCFKFLRKHVVLINGEQDRLSIAARVPLEGEFLGKQETLPAPKFDVNIPLQWWIDNNPLVRSGNLSFGKSLTAPSFDVTMEMLCGDNSTSAAIRLINVLEEAGFDVSAPKAEIVAMRKHLGNVEYGMKAIADACRRAGNKTISFRGAKAEFVIG